MKKMGIFRRLRPTSLGTNSLVPDAHLLSVFLAISETWIFFYRFLDDDHFIPIFYPCYFQDFQDVLKWPYFSVRTKDSAFDNFGSV